MTKTSKAWSLVVRIETTVWGRSKEAIRMSFTCEECTVLLEDAQRKPLVKKRVCYVAGVPCRKAAGMRCMDAR
jgi:hypothetical protein